MKKLFVFILLFITFINVKAETYYGEYKLIDNVDNIIENDEYLVEEKKLFNTYEEFYEDLGYLFETDDFMKIDSDFIEEELISNQYVDNAVEYIDIGIKENKIFEIYFKKIVHDTKINEIEIYYKDKLLSFECYLNYVKNIKQLYDKDLNTYMTSLSNSCFLRFILNMEYLIDDIKIVLYTPKDTNTNFKLSFDNEIFYPISLRGEKHIITFNNESEETIYSYKTKVRKYRYYNISKIPTNNYVEFGDNLIIDDYILKYNFYKRNKLVLKDNIIIDNKIFDIRDYIEYSSGEVISECNIDYNINGEYYCNFKLDDISINKKVILDIKEDINNVDVFEKEDLEVLNDKEIFNNIIESEVKENNSIEYSYSNIDINKEIEIKDVEDIDVIEESTKINREILNTSIKKKDNKNIGIIKYIFITLIILVEVLLFIKKKKNKTNVENI